MRRGALVAVLALGASFALSGCFLLQSFKWSSPTVRPGKSTYAEMNVVPLKGSGQTDPDRGYQAFIIGFPDSGNQVTLGKTKVFDTGGKFGGPFPMAQDQAVANEALNDQACTISTVYLSEFQNIDWTAVRTDKKVDDRDRDRISAHAKIQFHVKKSSPPTQEEIFIVDANWNDSNNNHVVEDNEVGCAGGTIPAITITK
jgi:hypothetical protein